MAPLPSCDALRGRWIRSWSEYTGQTGKSSSGPKRVGGWVVSTRPPEDPRIWTRSGRLLLRVKSAGIRRLSAERPSDETSKGCHGQPRNGAVMAAMGRNQVGNFGGVAVGGGEVAAAFGMARPPEPIAATVAAGQWLPVKAAAREAGVPELSAFRWARRGVVPVQRNGKVQLVEVAALRAYASRPVNGRGASPVEVCSGATAALLVTELQGPSWSGPAQASPRSLRRANVLMTQGEEALRDQGPPKPPNSYEARRYSLSEGAGIRLGLAEGVVSTMSDNEQDEKPPAGTWFKYPNPELVIGLVAAVGTDLDAVEGHLTACLRQFRYEPRTIRLSEFLKRIKQSESLEDSPRYRRLKTFMKAGSDLRKETCNFVFALHAAAEVRHQRGPATSQNIDATSAIVARPEVEEVTSTPQNCAKSFGKARVAYILHSLKHPDEVHALRKIFGVGFYLVGVHSEKEERKRNLTRDMTDAQAEELMGTDEEEDVKHGQQTRDTFGLADLFVTAAKADDQLRRAFDLIFGCPFITPTKDEHGMFMAYASSVKSGSLSRQVGAAVMTPRGDIVATGCNDAPRYGGGLYWPGPGDERDFNRGVDSNDQEKAKMSVRIMRALGHEGTDDELKAKAKDKLSNTGLFDVTEYGRDVHAEMDALTACARLGISVRGTTLFCTTFPCHNCAKHLVAAGIKRVVFVEPYPKSKALDLHSDAIAAASARSRRMSCEPFVGVGPRRYFDLFSIMGISTGFRVERKDGGRPVKWSREEADVRVPMRPTSYLDRESLAADDLDELVSWVERSRGGSNAI